MRDCFKFQKKTFIVTPLNTVDINNCLFKVSPKQYLGCYPCDKIPKTFANPPFGMVLNTQNSNGPGEHWLAIYVDKNNTVNYFDSLGFPPLIPEIRDYVERFKNKNVNNIPFQNMNSITCGHFSVAFLTLAFLGKSYTQIMSTFRNNKNNIDKYVTSVVQKLMCI